MLLALLAVAALVDWVPVRWISSDPASLDLLRGTRFNCVLLEPAQWDPDFLAAARQRGIAAAGVLSPGGGAARQAARAAELKLDALVLEGAPPVASSLPVIELLSRRDLERAPAEGVTGTWQGVWPGINPREEDNAALAGPTSAPWLDTNSGVLRYLRSRTRARLWIANRPPAGRAYPVVRYLQAMADAALAGARWVVALDQDFTRRLGAREARALKEWGEICSFADFLERQAAWRGWPSYGLLGLAQDPAQGAFVSGGVLDMLAVQHLPVRPVTAENAAGLRVLVNLTGKPVEAPVRVAPDPGWSFPMESPEAIAIRQADLPKLEHLWKRVSESTGRRNFGIRLFNGASLLSHPMAAPDGKRLAIPIVNYTGYPAEAVTVHLLGEWRKARLLAPGREPRELTLYPAREGSGLEIASLEVMAVVEVE